MLPWPFVTPDFFGSQKTIARGKILVQTPHMATRSAFYRAFECLQDSSKCWWVLSSRLRLVGVSALLILMIGVEARSNKKRKSPALNISVPRLSLLLGFSLKFFYAWTAFCLRGLACAAGGGPC